MDSVVIFLTSFKNLRPYQNGYRLVTLHTHGDFIVLPNWEIRPLTPWDIGSGWQKPDFPMNQEK